MPVPYRRLGRIMRTHGTHGEIVLALRDDLSVSSLEGIDAWIVPPPESGAVAHRVTEPRQGAKGVLVRLSGIDTPAAAHELPGRWLLAHGEDLPETTSTTDDLIGRRVEDSRRGFIGTVDDVIVTGANDVLVVEAGPFGQVLVPVIDGVILGLDASGVLNIALLDGLIDEEQP